MIDEKEEKRLTEKGESIMARPAMAFPHKNADVEDVKDMPKQKVERHDGLPTIDDLKELMHGKKCGEESEEGGEAKRLDDFIEVIIKIGK